MRVTLCSCQISNYICPVYECLQMAREGLIGDCDNRWFDKSVMCIVHKNGTVSVNCDVSMRNRTVVILLEIFKAITLC